MHGLEAAAGESGAHAVAGAVSHDHAEEDGTSGHDHSTCAECVAGHLLAACVAVLAAVLVLRVARRLVAVMAAPGALHPVVTEWRDRFTVWRPPDPAWVRLSVMRC
jgi:hypothetical protein